MLSRFLNVLSFTLFFWLQLPKDKVFRNLQWSIWSKSCHSCIQVYYKMKAFCKLHNSEIEFCLTCTEYCISSYVSLDIFNTWTLLRFQRGGGDNWGSSKCWCSHCGGYLQQIILFPSKKRWGIFDRAKLMMFRFHCLRLQYYIVSLLSVQIKRFTFSILCQYPAKRSISFVFHTLSFSLECISRIMMG